MKTSVEHLAELERILIQQGIRSALAYLNSLSHYRFTALYYFQDHLAKNLYFFDRDNPNAEAGDMDELPVTVTYCVYMRNSGQPFAIQDALRDDRLVGHPSQNVVQSYCGVPLLDSQGRTFGSMCQFDFHPVSLPPEQIELMEKIAPLLEKYNRLSQLILQKKQTSSNLFQP